MLISLLRECQGYPRPQNAKRLSVIRSTGLSVVDSSIDFDHTANSPVDPAAHVGLLGDCPGVDSMAVSNFPPKRPSVSLNNAAGDPSIGIKIDSEPGDGTTHLFRGDDARRKCNWREVYPNKLKNEHNLWDTLRHDYFHWSGRLSLHERL